jgi:DNA-binding GntR family transcriptional regulator
LTVLQTLTDAGLVHVDLQGNSLQTGTLPSTTGAGNLPELVGLTLGAQAKIAIRQAILSGTYAPGQRLSEVEIGAALRISRGPVREAIRALASEGLLELVPHRGPAVRRFTYDEFRELYEVRQALEGFAARLAAQRATRDDVTLLRHILRRVFEAAGSAEPPPYDLSFDFHLNVLRIARSAQLQTFTSAVDARLRLARSHSGHIPARARESFREHTGIVDALEASDAESAERLMREHLEQSQLHAEAVLRMFITKEEPKQR